MRAEQRKLILSVTLFKVGNRDADNPNALLGWNDRSHEIEARLPQVILTRGEAEKLRLRVIGSCRAIMRRTMRPPSSPWPTSFFMFTIQVVVLPMSQLALLHMPRMRSRMSMAALVAGGLTSSLRAAGQITRLKCSHRLAGMNRLRPA